MTMDAPPPLMLVEDNPADVLLTQRALKKNRVANELLVMEDGESALDYLHQRNGHEGATPPAFILLDLNLQGIAGHEAEGAEVGSGAAPHPGHRLDQLGPRHRRRARLHRARQRLHGQAGGL